MQIINYNKLAETVTEKDANGITKDRLEFTETTTGKEILNNIRDLQKQFQTE